MTTAVLVLSVLLAADLLFFGAALGVAGWQYRHVRREAASRGQVLPQALGQFVFVALMLAAGVAGHAVAIFGLMETF